MSALPSDINRPDLTNLLPAEIIQYLGSKINTASTLGAFAQTNKRVYQIILNASEPLLNSNRFLGSELAAARALSSVERLEKTFHIAMRYRDKLSLHEWEPHMRFLEKKDCGYGSLPTLALLAPGVLKPDCPLHHSLNRLLDTFDLNYCWTHSNIPARHKSATNQEWCSTLFSLAVQGGLNKITEYPKPEAYGYPFAAVLMEEIAYLPPAVRLDSLLAAAQLPSTLFYDVCMKFLGTINIVFDDLLAMPIDQQNVKLFLETLELARYYSDRHRKDFVYTLIPHLGCVLKKLPAAHWRDNDELALHFVLGQCAWAAAGSNFFRTKGSALSVIKKHCIKTGFFTEKEWARLETELRKPGHSFAAWLKQAKQQKTMETHKNNCLIN